MRDLISWIPGYRTAEWLVVVLFAAGDLCLSSSRFVVYVRPLYDSSETLPLLTSFTSDLRYVYDATTSTIKQRRPQSYWQ
jgi:hypothetical protein